MNQLKVLHFFWNAEAGGRENLVYQLIKEQLKDDEINVSLLLGERKGYYIKLIEDLGIKVYYLPSNKEFAPKNYKYILSLLRQFDVIHIHGVNLLVIIAVILSKSKSIFTFHGKRNFSKITRIIKKLIFAFYIKKYANSITVNTHFLKKNVLSNYKLNKQKIHVIYNCIETQNLIKQNIDTNNFVIGTIGRIVEAKRIDRLLEAFSIFKQKYPQQYLKSKLLIIGGGVLSSKLKLKAKKLGILESVNFTGFVDDINTYRSKIDLFVVSSGIMDSFPLTFLEAMYCKIPVVCFTDSGGVPEVIKDKVNGFLVKNEEGLANCFNEFMEITPEIQEKIVKNAYIMLQKDLTIASYANKYKALYNQVI